MSIITPVSGFDSDESEELAFKRLSAEEAQALRERQPSVSPWRIVAVQVMVTLLVALAAWGFTGRSGAAWSAGYGGLAVVIPAVLFARGLMSQFSSLNAATAGFGFFVWEAIKIAVSVGMLFAAPQLVTDLDWLAMLIGLIVTLKVYWVALLMRPKSKRSFSGN
ncbi:MAG: ATP synthase subunit I [Rhodoferax sp.]|uniref:ATP synthase subunit I n=1 Tax=Rhodoferax sp. TaxID=50421 RepID=UPI002629089C|nr:ATP synthase subunit I [Rhodoferax sp.]MDD5336382.1 ATP synthase subunit I [Rhodoferax sp.]